MTQQKSFSQPKKNKTRQNLSVARRRPTTGEKKKKNTRNYSIAPKYCIETIQRNKRKGKEKKKFSSSSSSGSSFPNQKKKVEKNFNVSFQGTKFSEVKRNYLSERKTGLRERKKCQIENYKSMFHKILTMGWERERERVYCIYGLMGNWVKSLVTRIRGFYSKEYRSSSPEWYSQ